VDSGEIHWRSLSKDNIATLYGKTEKSRIADPDDSTDVFSWLLCESYDDKGNAIRYKYKSETTVGRMAHSSILIMPFYPSSLIPHPSSLSLHYLPQRIKPRSHTRLILRQSFMQRLVRSAKLRFHLRSRLP
jgi:hypothetical protein